MDDRQVYALARLKLAYKKQLLFIKGLMILAVMGVIAYVITVYEFNMALLLIAIAFIGTGIIGIMTVDQKLKNISRKIKELEKW